MSGEGLGELGVVPLLPAVEPEVLEENDRARRQPFGRSPRRRTHAILRELDRRVDSAGERLRDRSQGTTGVAHALRATEVAGDHQRRAAPAQKPHGRREPLDPGRIRDRPIAQRRI